MLEITKVRKDDPSGLDKPENAELKALWERHNNALKEKRRQMYSLQFVSEHNKSTLQSIHMCTVVFVFPLTCS